MRITYGAHAIAMMSERGLDPVWIERTVIEPDFVEPDAMHPERIRAYRAVPERDGRMLRVVYVPAQDGARVVTAFFDRNRRRSP